MYRIGLHMLTQDKAKFYGLILSLSFSALIITQQAAIFLGLIRRTYSTITDTPQPDIWVMNPNVRMIDDIKPLRNTDLYQVRSIEGVKWAVPFFKGLIRARLPDGQFQTCIVIGVDDATLVGAPTHMLEGSIFELRYPDAIIVDDFEIYDKLSIRKNGTSVPLQMGDVLELNDQRAVVRGICRLTRPFATQPIVYTTYKRALRYAPYERTLLSFILVKADGSIAPKELCERINRVTGFLALTEQEFAQKTKNYYLKYTGIAINFGLAVLLGILVGAGIAGQIFFYFISENLPYLALLSVMGASKKVLAKITIMQAAWVALLSWNIGAGCAALIGYLARGSQLSFFLPLWLYLSTGIIIFLICIISAFFNVSRIYKIDLAEVFKQ